MDTPNTTARGSSRRSVTAIGCSVMALAAALGAEAAETGDVEPGSVSEPYVEEVRVTGERVVTDLTLEQRREIYKQLAEGRRLYSDSQYKRAFPLLLNTAKHGFKDAQARVGYIYLQGLGEVLRDSTVAVGWLGVAASGNTSPGIENYFNDIWKRIPEQHVPYFREVVEEYESKYGEYATGVACDLNRRVASYIKRLSCFFKVDQLALDELSYFITENSTMSTLDSSSSARPPDLDTDTDSE